MLPVRVVCGSCLHRRGAVAEHPALLINAVNNTIYWVALLFVLREPLGVVLVVLAFLLAGFLTAPLESLVGIDGDKGADALVSALCAASAAPCSLASRRPLSPSGLRLSFVVRRRLACLPSQEQPFVCHRCLRGLAGSTSGCCSCFGSGPGRHRMRPVATLG